MTFYNLFSNQWLNNLLNIQFIYIKFKLSHNEAAVENNKERRLLRNLNNRVGNHDDHQVQKVRVPTATVLQLYFQHSHIIDPNLNTLLQGGKKQVLLSQPEKRVWTKKCCWLERRVGGNDQGWDFEGWGQKINLNANSGDWLVQELQGNSSQWFTGI